MIEVIGDVTKPQRSIPSEIVVIPHCCNDLGLMGGGVALALSKKWSKVYEVYTRNYELGNVTFAECEKDTTMDCSGPAIIVANMVGQHGVRGARNPKPIKYAALIKCMERVAEEVIRIKECSGRDDVVIHAPKFGSDLACGRWEFIEELIEEIWEDHGIEVVIYEFPEK